jgi:hypothetical protein
MNMPANILQDANKQWASRPAEERFTSLDTMQDHFDVLRDHSRSAVVSSRAVFARPTTDNQGLLIAGPSGAEYTPTHHAFGQLATLAGAPAGYLRNLPAPMAVDCINYGLHVDRDIEDVGLLLTRNGGAPVIRAATGPRYGRVWNSDVIRALRDRFGDGITGNFRVPGEFGQRVDVTQANTTLYASDQDCFVFLADEENRIAVHNRRDGQTGTLARGFFVSNSEVGAGSLKIRTFLFDYVCSNRIVWGADNVQDLSIRHTASAPDRFIEQVQPALLEYAQSSAAGIESTLKNAQALKIDRVQEFLAKRFGPRVAAKIEAAHVLDEGRPIETIWDAVTGATAYARGIEYTAARVDFEAQAGDLLKLAA